MQETMPEVIDAATMAAPNLHDVNQNAVRAAGDGAPAAPAANLPTNAAGRRDRNGDTFDADVHEVDASGAAVLRSDGLLKIRPDKRGRGRLKSFIPPPPAPEPAAAAAPDAPPVEPVAPSIPPEIVARSLVVPALAWARVLLGPEWKMEAEERGEYVDAVAAIVARRAVNIDLPPEIGLLGLVGASIAKRADQPKTGAWLGRMKSMILGWFGLGRSEPKDVEHQVMTGTATGEAPQA